MIRSMFNDIIVTLMPLCTSSLHISLNSYDSALTWGYICVMEISTEIPPGVFLYFPLEHYK